MLSVRWCKYVSFDLLIFNIILIIFLLLGNILDEG